MNHERRRILKTLPALGAMALPLAAHASPSPGWPAKPIRLILPYAAGGPTDVVARALAAKMSQQLGQSIIVENHTGASGNIACEFVARAAPDGYTALYHSSGFAISPALYRKLPYDPVKDFAPVGLAATIPTVLMVNRDLPVKTIQEFVAYLKSHPNQLSYGTGGVGNITHLVVALFLQANQAQAVHVPYKGTAPAMTDLIGGLTQFMLDAVNSSLPFIKDGRVRALALASKEPLAALPGVPTLDGSVMPGFVAPTWHGVLLPAATPREVVTAFNAALAKAARDPGLDRQFSAQGVTLESSTPEQFSAYLQAEIARWRQAATAAGVQPE
ncbi:Bug family tripartite tricarboxylate transporter substrate binding protein [Achromobacter aloeverae]